MPLVFVLYYPNNNNVLPTIFYSTLKYVGIVLAEKSSLSCNHPRPTDTDQSPKLANVKFNYKKVLDLIFAIYLYAIEVEEL